MDSPTKRAPICNTVADHIIEEVRRRGAKGDTRCAIIVVFCTTSHECTWYSDRVTTMLEYSNTEIYTAVSPHIVKCRCLSTGSDVHIHFFAIRADRGPRGVCADHIVSIGFSLHNSVMMDTILPLSLQPETTAVIVTNEELKQGETKLQPVLSWAFEEVTRERNYEICGAMLPLLRNFTPCYSE